MMTRPSKPQPPIDGTALILCEGAFTTTCGKTAHGLVRHTHRYRILGVLDSRFAGRDAGEVLDGKPCGIPIYRDFEDSLAQLGGCPDYLIIGLAPDGGRLPEPYRKVVAEALRRGINVDSGLHDFLGDDPQLAALARAHSATIRDVRKPPPRDRLHFFTGAIERVGAHRIAVLGTDSALGKRTTATILNAALSKAGVASTVIGTGQTSWFQGVRHGIVLDSLVNDFVSGEIEHAICEAQADLHPEVMLLEGQGGLTHPAYPGGFELIAAGRPDGLILQHAPLRKFYDGIEGYPLGGLEREVQLLRLLSSAPLVAITINHEGMQREQLEPIVRDYEAAYGCVACDVLWQGAERLVDAVRKTFPDLGGKR